MVKKNIFREDLYWRLNVVPILIPPLRERREDIPVFVDYFLKKFNKEYGKEISFDSKALERLILYSWPGNIRELVNTIERIVLLTENNIVLESDLPIFIKPEVKSDLLKKPQDSDS